MRSPSWTLHALVLAALLAGGTFGCGDDSGAGDSSKSGKGDGGDGRVTESPNVGDSVKKAVTAADGGEVALKDAGIMLMIPAGALGDDTEITAEVVSKTDLPGAADLEGNVVKFGPDGLKFSMPVELSIDLGGAKAPKDAAATISWLDEKKGKWVDLEGSKVVDGKVVADTTHFTIFAVRFVVNASGQVEQTAGQCSGNFKACGGDIEGTWNVTSGCADLTMPINANPGCAGASFEFGIDITGDITFAKGTLTGTLMLEQMQTEIVPKTCNGGMCDTAGTDEVVTDKGDTCETTKNTMETKTVDSSYVIDGSTIQITDSTPADAGTGTAKPNPPGDFCVTGDTLVVVSHEDNGVDLRWTATRK
jgi:hypothetical protein